MFWLGNKNIIFLLRTLNSWNRPNSSGDMLKIVRVPVFVFCLKNNNSLLFASKMYKSKLIIVNLFGKYYLKKIQVVSELWSFLPADNRQMDQHEPT